MCLQHREAVGWDDLEEAIDEIDLLLAVLGGSEEVAKSSPDPLDPDGFDRWTDRFARAVLRSVKRSDQRAVRRMIRALDQKWTELSIAARGRLIDEAMAKIAISTAELVKVSRVIAETSEAAIKATRGALRAKQGVDISATFDAIDRQVVDHVRRSQANFVRDAYGRRRSVMSRIARNIVAEGIDAGMSSTDVGAELADRMSRVGLNRARNYWDSVSSVYMGRARAQGQVRGYEQAGIERLRFVAVGDERTTPMCSYYDGKVWSVRRVSKTIQDVAAASDPEAVVSLQPFLNVGAAPDGSRILYFKRGDARVAVARSTGARFEPIMSDEALARAGVMIPPLHPMCRSTTVPV